MNAAGVQKALVAQEITSLFSAAGGEQLKPDAVWRWAKDHPDSALYKEFDWDLQVAAERHWTNQARGLIASVTILPNKHVSSKPIRAFVSLSTDRGQGLGYRRAVDVLASVRMRHQHLEDVFAEYERLITRYGHLPELEKLHIAVKTGIELVRADVKKAQQRRRRRA